MDLVGQHDDPVLEADLAHPRQVLGRPAVARRVLRIAQDEGVGPARSTLEVVEVDPVAPVHELHRALLRHRAGEAEVGVEAAVDRRGHEHARARRREGLQRVDEAGVDARRQLHGLGIDLEPVAP